MMTSPLRDCFPRDQKKSCLRNKIIYSNNELLRKEKRVSYRLSSFKSDGTASWVGQLLLGTTSKNEKRQTFYDYLIYTRIILIFGNSNYNLSNILL